MHMITEIETRIALSVISFKLSMDFESFSQCIVLLQLVGVGDRQVYEKGDVTELVHGEGDILSVDIR